MLFIKMFATFLSQTYLFVRSIFPTYIDTSTNSIYQQNSVHMHEHDDDPLRYALAQ